MRDYVIINGVNSLTINGLAISKLPPISKPLMRNMKEEIDGRDGDIITELGYSAYDKAMEIGLYGNFDINEVISFFNGEGTITFSNEEDKHYYFKILEQIDYEKLLKFKTATITFHCQPFKYPNNEQIIDVDSLTIEGTGTDITLNNTSLYEPINIDLLGDTIQDGTPTPESPIEVQTVTGRQEIEVCGKNLLNTNLMKKFTPTQVTWYSLDGVTAFYNVTNIEKSNIYYNVKANQTYTFSVHQYNNININLSSPIQLVRGDNAAVVCSLTSSSSFEPVSFTPTEDLKLYPRISVESANVETQCIVQLEKGSVATEYEEYKGKSYEINLGKNLFDKDNVVILNANLSNSKINSNANERVAIIKCEPNTTYTFSKVIPSSYIRNTIATTSAYPTLNMTIDNAVYSATSPKTYTTGANAQYIVWLFWSASDTTYTEQQNLDSMQVEKGSQATSYAPYKTPIELSKIGDYQDCIRKSTGSNLFNKDDIETGVYIDASGNIVTASATCYSNYIEVQPNTTYSIVGRTAYRSQAFYDKNKSFIKRDNNQESFTTGDTTYYIRINGITNEVGTYMLNKGSSPLPYEPYNSKDKWLLQKEIGKVVLDGSEEYIYQNNTFRINISDLTTIGDSKIREISNYYQAIPYSASWGNYDYFVSNTNGSPAKIVIKNKDITSTSDFKTWLSTHNTEVYYVLATPTTTEITDTELLAQLILLSNATTYDETTNILSIGDLPSILNVSATSIPTTTITNIGNIYAKPLLTIKGSGDISVYLNGIQLLQIALGDREEITIDISKMEAYDEETKVLLNRLVIGDYSKFLINSGVNELLITGDVSNFTMSNYTRWL